MPATQRRYLHRAIGIAIRRSGGNLFEMGGRRNQPHFSVPEVDRGDWFDREQAFLKIVKGQRPILERFYAALG
jgi:predicted NUDIX family NTP pyrophosphohydrolase